MLLLLVNIGKSEQELKWSTDKGTQKYHDFIFILSHGSRMKDFNSTPCSHACCFASQATEW
jgi:hypothetical protein